MTVNSFLKTWEKKIKCLSWAQLQCSHLWIRSKWSSNALKITWCCLSCGWQNSPITLKPVSFSMPYMLNVRVKTKSKDQGEICCFWSCSEYRVLNNMALLLKYGGTVSPPLSSRVPGSILSSGLWFVLSSHSTFSWISSWFFSALHVLCRQLQ